MKEAQLQGKFTRWLKAGKFKNGIGAFELKIGKGERIPFSSIADHQVFALMKVKGLHRGPLAYKISDSGIGYKPFDCFVMVDCDALFVFGFNDGKDVMMVDVEDVEDLMFDEYGNKKRGSVSLSWCIDVGGERIEI